MGSLLNGIVLKSKYQAVFDAITQLVATTLNVPLALITYVDERSLSIHFDTSRTLTTSTKNANLGEARRRGWVSIVL